VNQHRIGARKPLRSHCAAALKNDADDDEDGFILSLEENTIA
jgi:hypothetical protein